MTIAFKGMRQRLLASSLTALSVALGVMLMVGVLVTYSIVSRSFQQTSIGYDLVVGRQGSDLQLVLSTVYRIGNPPANVPYRYLLHLRNNPLVESAVPVTMGDTTEKGGFKIVGTVNEFFDHPYAPDRKFQVRESGPDGTPGGWFEESYDAVIGWEVARENGWNEGSQFRLVHGSADSESGIEPHVHDELFTVKGVLAPTYTANDRTVFVQLGGFYSIAGHEVLEKEAVRREREFFGDEYEEIVKQTQNLDDPESGAAIPMEQKEVTAIFVNMRTPSSAVMMAGSMKKGHRAQAVNPIQPMQRLMALVVGNVAKALVAMTVLVIVVSGVSIFVSIYNSMSDRKKEIAVMRALGAQRSTVFAIIMSESVLLCVCGGIFGIVLGHGLVFLAAPILEAKTGLLVDPLAFHQLEFALLPALIVLASLVGFIPGLTAYHTDVAEALAE